MRKLFLAIAAIVFVVVSTGTIPAFAEDAPNKGTTVSPNDAQKVKDAAQFLGTAFGVKSKKDEPKQEQSKKDESAQEEHKTLADVADKGLDMVQNFVVALSQTLSKIAPEVWRVMVRQQYAKAVSGVIVPWGLFIITMIYFLIVKKAWKKDEDESDDDKTARMLLVSVIPFIFGFIFAIWGVVNLKDSILLLINPEYYAIQDLLTMILQ